MKKKLSIIFLSAFLLNLVWENAHSALYIHYKGQYISETILIRASLFDALVTLLGALLFLFIPPFRGRLWLVFLGLVTFTIGLEIFALETSRWAYKDTMPILPVFNVGLTPTVQLALLATLSYWVARLSKASFRGRLNI